ncbi:MAG: hypothetical protein K8R21_11755 [Leptospira sp.]|nr:hypothetical protein [Leptospira sp.]
MIKDIETGQNTNIALNTIEVFDFDGKKLFWYSGHFSKSESSADRIPYGLIAKQCMGVTNDYGEILCFAKPLVKGKKYIFAPSIEGAPYIRDIENLIFVH